MTIGTETIWSAILANGDKVPVYLPADTVQVVAEKYAAALPSPEGMPLVDYIAKVSPSFVTSHLRKVADLFDRAASGEQVKAVVHVPPAHGYTNLAIHALAQRAALYVAQGKLTSRLCYVSADKAARSRVATQVARLASAEITVVHPGENLTGYVAGFDLVVVDGLIYNEPIYPIYAANLAEWMDGPMFNRLSPNGSIIVGPHARNDHDVQPRLFGLKHGKEWDVTILAAMGEDGPLCPERFSAETLDEIRAKVGEQKWEALYQGGPIRDAFWTNHVDEDLRHGS